MTGLESTRTRSSLAASLAKESEPLARVVDGWRGGREQTVSFWLYRKRNGAHSAWHVSTQ